MAKKRDMEGNRLHHFELSDTNRTVRWVLIIILLAVAAVSITIGLLSVLQTPAGWQTVSGNSSALNCGNEFVLQYNYGAGEESPTVESKTLEPLYGKAIEDAWKLFFNEAGATDLKGLYEINQHPNEQTAVDSGLYAALEQMVEGGSRALYLAPIYAEYDILFRSENDTTAQEYDPAQNADQKAYTQLLADFANDPESISLVLNSDSMVTLRVSQEYLDFAKTNEIRYLVDFGWLRNALIADYIASVLSDNGFTNGYIASADGFTRNLDQNGNSYSLNLFNRFDDGIDLAAVMDYSAPKSLVSLRNYPMSGLDTGRYYSFSDGRIVTSMIDPADGQSKSALHNLVSYSESLSCGQLALRLMPVFVADTFSEDALNGLTQQGIYSVWFEGREICHNQPDLKQSPNDPYYLK